MPKNTRVLDNPYLDLLDAREAQLAALGAQSVVVKLGVRTGYTDYPYAPHWWNREDEPPQPDRKALVTRFAWAIPSTEIVTRLVRWAPRIVEVGAGSGYWAWLLTQAGADVVAYDRQPPGPAHAYQHTVGYVPVRRASAAEAARRHPDRALFLCWPPYRDPMADRALRAYRGDQVLYIGEWNGCTGSSAFHARLTADWRRVWTADIPQYAGLHDRCFAFRRKRPRRTR